VAPPPAVTEINRLSKAYWRVSTWGRILWPAVAPVHAWARSGLLLIRRLVPCFAETLAKPIGNAIRREGARLLASFKTALQRMLFKLAQALAVPALVALALTPFLLMNPNFPTTLQEHIQAPAAALPIAVVPVGQTPFFSEALPLPKPNPSRPAARLIRFHGSHQIFQSHMQATAALADALNIPQHVVAGDVSRALALAASNSEAMQRHATGFPLPKETSQRLLAALTPSDVQHLARFLEHSTTIGIQSFTLAADLPSGELRLETKVEALSAPNVPRRCFRYAMTFMRRSFRHTLNTTACREGRHWSVLAAKQDRSAK
jgi:hypothetical protein